MGEEAIEGAEVAGDGLGSSVPVKAILQILSFVLFSSEQIFVWKF